MLAIIPARGGSKGLPGKNIRKLCGRPLIEYTIDAALRSKFVSRVVVSTESASIAEVAVAAGAEVPFLRPEHLATDSALAIDVYLYTCDRLMSLGAGPISDFVTLQPTSPLRLAEDVDAAISLFREKNADSVISVTESARPFEWLRSIGSDGVLRKLEPPESGVLRNRQECEKTYMVNGAIYVFKCELLKESRDYYSEMTFPYVVPPERSVDIDTILDFEIAEYLMGRLRTLA
jgi:N-acylneuraminate cytidylyltransferase/CMP-N,N'-diacetyllegionaminic acid synthase